ncbi:MAG: hypothetical protein QM718_14350 [Steroidobacteraceae bacterium]
MNFRKSWLLGALLLSCVAHGADGQLPWKKGDEAPAVAGIRLGDEREKIEKLLGEAPERKELDNGALGLIYPQRGVAFVIGTHGAGVALMYLMSPAAGDLDGVHWGDTRDVVLAHWGEPTLVQGAQAFYVVGSWNITVELGEGQQISVLSVGRASGELEQLLSE